MCCQAADLGEPRAALGSVGEGLLPPAPMAPGGAKVGAHLPVVDVVIFAAPAPVIVWEPIDLCELLLAQGRHTSKILVVG